MLDSPDAMRARAADLLQRRRFDEAAAIYRLLAALPDPHADDCYNLGYALRAAGQPEAALQAYARALTLGVQGPEEVHLNRSVIYTDELRQDALAEQELQQALACRPGYVPALLNLGNLHEERGEREAALACYRQLVSPDEVARSGLRAHDMQLERRCEALARWVALQPPRHADDVLVKALQRPLPAGADVSLAVRANLKFALGRALDGLGDHDRAFAAFDKANRLARQTAAPHDRRRTESLVSALMQASPLPQPQDGLPAKQDESPAASGGPEPLFVCGMFRSGSTLIEQVLSAHPKVQAGGELELLPRWVAGRLAPFPASLQAMDDTQAAALANEYRSHVQRLFPDARSCAYITDKRPDNYQYIGLIKRMFPRARIVHTVRHPLDNGLSIFTQHLSQRALGYASDLGDIGHHFGQYRRLMAHWQALYAGSIHHFDYDDFVREPEPALRRLLDFLGLTWDPRCLDFHTVRNTVKTASYWQVRQPLHRSASGRWRPYAAHLQPLRQALVEAGVELPED